MKADTTACPICNRPTASEVLSETHWSSPELLHCLAGQHPRWQREDGACPACLQQALLQLLLEEDEIRWLVDPSNPRKRPDGFGGFNSILTINDQAELEPVSITKPIMDALA